MCQEFRLSITHLQDNDYLLRTEDVAEGVPLAQEKVTWPVEQWLEKARHLMNDPLLRVFQSQERLGNWLLSLPPRPEEVEMHKQSSVSLMTFGQELFAALFTGSVASSWQIAQGIAHHKHQVIRLRLGLKENRLLRLPWEVLNEHHAITDGDSAFRPLTTGTAITFCRYYLDVPLAKPDFMGRDRQQFAPGTGSPCKILMVLSSPHDHDRLSLKQEALHMKTELEAPGDGTSPPISLEILENPGRETITQKLEQGFYQGFHYSGHSNLGDDGGALYLVNRETGLSETLSGKDLGGLLINNGIQFAIFNSCNGTDTLAAGPENPPNPDPAEPWESDRNRNLAQSLIQVGIPAVVAMAAKIPDQVALTVTKLLYRNLHQGYPLDFSLNRTRQGLISSYGSDQLYWALPVIYMHPRFDGSLGPEFTPIASPPPLDSPEGEKFQLSLEDKALLNLDEGDWDLGSPTADFLGPDDTEAEPPPDAPGEEMELKSLIQEVFQETPLPFGDEDPLGSEDQDWVATIEKEELSDLKTGDRSSPNHRPMVIIGGALVFILGALALYPRLRPPEPPNLPPEVAALDSPPELPVGEDLSQVSTEVLSRLAFDSMGRQEWATGEAAIQALLDRNVIKPAIAALSTVPQSQQDRPTIRFLWGRVAWQSALGEESPYTIGDARRYWEMAATSDRNFIHLNALAFAYYSEDRPGDAQNYWSEAISVATMDLPNALINQAYAGLALSLQKNSPRYSPDQQRKMLGKAIAMREKVLRETPTEFQAQTLATQWQWSPQAIADWQNFLRTPNPQSSP